MQVVARHEYDPVLPVVIGARTARERSVSFSVSQKDELKSHGNH